MSCVEIAFFSILDSPTLPSFCKSPFVFVVLLEVSSLLFCPMQRVPLLLSCFYSFTFKCQISASCYLVSLCFFMSYPCRFFTSSPLMIAFSLHSHSEGLVVARKGTKLCIFVHLQKSPS